MTISSLDLSNPEIQDRCWAALVDRDPQYEGLFFYGVRTTGVYCRPTCVSRLPRRENVQFFVSAVDAETAGFRPCKRCQPQQPSPVDPRQAAILQACQVIDQAETEPTLAELAAAAGLSPFYFQRLFKKAVGISPKQYFLEKRAGRVRHHLQQEARVTDAVYNAGYSSSSQFYSQAAATLGMRPSTYRKGGAGQYLEYALVEIFLGWMLVAGTEQGISTIQFGDSPDGLEQELYRRFPGAVLQRAGPDFLQRVTAVAAFVEAPARDFPLPLDVQGTAFQRQVWTALRAIPPGATASYAEIAARIGKPGAVRAVAQACAANPTAVAIPCHRVIRTGGGLGGYRWGIDRKQKLLEREKNTGG